MRGRASLGSGARKARDRGNRTTKPSQHAPVAGPPATGAPPAPEPRGAIVITQARSARLPDGRGGALRTRTPRTGHSHFRYRGSARSTEQYDSMPSLSITFSIDSATV